MALIFMEGFDKYGGVNSNSAGVVALLTAGEWTSASAAGAQLVAPLSATGNALAVFQQNNNISKTLSASYGRLIGGFRFSSNLGGFAGIGFFDGGSAQASVVVTAGGVFSVRNGALGTGTILATSTASVSANSTHYLEFDITFGNSASYQIWLDGVSILSGTGDTTTTANNTANAILLGVGTGATWSFMIDDFYLFDATGTTNNAVLLTSPRIETSFPTSDSAAQFAFGAGILGSSVGRGGSNYGPAANNLYLRPFTPPVNCTINSITLIPSATNGSINLRPVIYGETAGVPGTLMSAGSTVTGIVSGTAITMPLTTPQALTAGTRYWLGLMNDVTQVNAYAGADATASGRFALATFSSGAPGTAPTTTGGQNTVLLWGNLTGIAVNYDEVNNQPPDGQYSYVYDSVATHEDLYNFANLSAPPAQVYAVAVKAYCAKSDAGTKTVSMRVKSSATDSGGSSTGQALGTTFGWLTSLFINDPNGNIPWTGAAINAAQIGFRVDS